MDHHQTSNAPTIACMNVRYSPNLGDGLLAECLEHVLRDHGAAPATRSIDLAGRTRYGQQMAGRGAIMTVLEALPPGLRQTAIRLPLAVQSQRKWGPHYDAGLVGAQAVAIGGGNLIADLDLNFPTKLRLAMDHAHRRALPAAVFGCGMSAGWSTEGLRRLKTAFAKDNLRAVYLRDAASKDLWDMLVAPATGHTATVVRDPGLLASNVWPHRGVASGRIGVGVMSHIAIRYHGQTGISAPMLERWYLDLIDALQRAGREVVVFTNGSAEDVALLTRLQPSFKPGVVVANPQTPEELARLIAACTGIVAFRMHAIIAAYSYGVPALALAWDTKLRSFMASVNRADWLHEPAVLPAAEAAQLIMTGAEEGVDDALRRTVLAEARADVGKLLAVLR